MPDYKYRARLIEDGTMLSLARTLRRSEYLNWLHDVQGLDVSSPLSKDSAIELREKNFSNPDFQESVKIDNAQVQRSWRLNEKIRDILLNASDPVFATLTFTDEVLNSTSADTRKRYVKRYLKEQSCGLPYVANIDFGAEYGREHYHAVCAFRLDPKKWHHLGAIKLEKVRNSSKSEKKLSKYISKLTNHGIKETCRLNRIIYSRGSSFDNQ